MTRGTIRRAVIAMAGLSLTVAVGAGAAPAGPAAPTVPAVPAGRVAGAGVQVDVGVASGRIEALRPRGVNGPDQPSLFRPIATAINNAIPQNGIAYHGGPVVMGEKVVAIYWAASPIYSGGPAAGTTGAAGSDGSLVGYFLRNLGASPYYAINTTYKNGANVPVSTTVNYTKFVAVNQAPPTKPSVTATVNLILNQINKGKITFDEKTLYVVFGGPKIDIGGSYAQGACAYHTVVGVSNGNQTLPLLFSAQPLGSSFQYCHLSSTQWTPPNADLPADVQVNMLAHEIEETATDMHIDGWYDASGDENADKCAWYFGSTQTSASGGDYNLRVGTKPFMVQMNWARAGGCKKQL